MRCYCQYRSGIFKNDPPAVDIAAIVMSRFSEGGLCRQPGIMKAA